MTSWRAHDIPDLTGRRAVVTGANSGLGFHTALELARHGAAVVMTSRSLSAGVDAARKVREAVPGADLTLGLLDLADLESVREFVEGNEQPIDILINNAGVMAIPRRRTSDGFEMQLGTNHLGHFALTGLLMPALVERPGGRVVTVSSSAHRMGAMNFDDLMGDRSYSPWTAYAQSKLANLLFMAELDRRLRKTDFDLLSVAAHPGIASTNLQSVGPRMARRRLTGLVTKAGTLAIGQSAANGALPQLYAATAPGVESGDYIGPRGLGELRGLPRKVGRSAAARDTDAARQLWEESALLTRVRFSALQLRQLDLRRAADARRSRR
jgi:NAD(P)-dependent dehydrogenase (short-subunit alcohol dehydrogenase family)